MKKSEEYYNEFISKLSGSQGFRKFVYLLDKNELINIIKQIQSETIEETCNICAEKARAEIKTEWEFTGGSESYTDYAIVKKDSILNCAEILKKEIE